MTEIKKKQGWEKKKPERKRSKQKESKRGLRRLRLHKWKKITSKRLIQLKRKARITIQMHRGNIKTRLVNMKKDVQKQNITDDENEDYGVSDQEIIRIAR